MELRPILSTLLRHRTAAALIVMEIALSCAILCNALFLVSERVESMLLPSGIAEDALLSIQMGGGVARLDADARSREDLALLGRLPGVASVTVTNQLPFSRTIGSNNAFSLSPDQAGPTIDAAMYNAGERFLDTLGLHLVGGRDFLPEEYQDGSTLFGLQDLGSVRSAVIVSAEAAARLFPQDDPIGRTIYMSQIPLTIVGVVDALARPSLVNADSRRSVIFPIRLNPDNGGVYVLRAADPGAHAALLASATSALERADPGRPVLEAQSYRQLRADFFAEDRDMAGLMLLVCGLLLLVTALGIVGLASFWVQQRTKQIGIRRALGATRHQILLYFQTENFLLTSMGIVLGMLLAFALNQLLMAHYALPRLPPGYLPVGALLLWGIGQLAVYWPARRAASIPPAVATRSI